MFYLIATGSEQTTGGYQRVKRNAPPLTAAEHADLHAWMDRQMISEPLRRAVDEIDECLKDLPDTYTAEMRSEIIDLRNRMDATRQKLDP